MSTTTDRGGFVTLRGRVYAATDGADVNVAPSGDPIWVTPRIAVKVDELSTAPVEARTPRRAVVVTATDSDGASLCSARVRLDGTFRVRVPRSVIDEHGDELLLQVRNSAGDAITSWHEHVVVRDLALGREVPVVLEVRPDEDLDSDGTFVASRRIFGRVVRPNGSPALPKSGVVSLQVQVLVPASTGDGMTEAAVATVSATGTYDVTVPVPHTAISTRSVVQLVVRKFLGSSTTPIEVGRTALVRSLRPIERIHVRTSALAPGRHEYEYLIAEPDEDETVGGLGLEAAWPASEPATWTSAHVEALAEATKAPSTVVNRYLRARQLEAAIDDLIEGEETLPTGLREVLYGALAAGVAPSLQALSELSAAEWGERVGAAAEANFVDASWQDEAAAETVEEIADFVSTVVARAARVNVRSRLSIVLGSGLASHVDPAVEAVIGGQDTDEHWAAFAATLPSGDRATVVRRARFVSRLSRIAGGHEPFVDHLLGGGSPLVEPSTLAAWDLADFKALYDEEDVEVPEGVTDTRDLARNHMTQLELLYPEYVLAAQASGHETANTTLVLSRLGDLGIRFETADFGSLAEDTEHEMWEAVETHIPTIVTAMQSLQRTWRLVPPLLRHPLVRAVRGVETIRPSAAGIASADPDAARALLSAAFEEALDEADAWSPTVPEGASTSPLQDAAGSFARHTVATAAAVHARTFAQFGPWSGRSPTSIVGPPDPGTLTHDLPVGLLGCACDHCTTVFSPSAYMLDLLDSLKNHDLLLGLRTHADATTDAFLNRRDDIPRLKASCANSHTEVPAIDLINEILEYRVVAAAIALDIPKGGTLEVPILVAPADLKALPTETSGSSAERRAFPEHTLNSALADTLTARAPFLWPPFNAPAAELSGLLAGEDVTRAELLDATSVVGEDNFLTETAITGGPFSQPTASEVASAYFGWTPSECEALKGLDDAEVRDWYGYDAESQWLTNLPRLDRFLRATRLTVDEALALLGSEYVNRGFAYGLLSDTSEGGSACDPELTVITTAAILPVTSVSVQAETTLRVVTSAGTLFTTAGFVAAGGNFEVALSALGFTFPVPEDSTVYLVSTLAGSRAIQLAVAADDTRIATIHFQGSGTDLVQTPDPDFYRRVLTLRIVARAIGGSFADATHLLRTVLTEQQFRRGAPLVDADLIRLVAVERLRRTLSLERREVAAFLRGYHGIGAWDGRVGFDDVWYTDRFERSTVYRPPATALALAANRRTITGGAPASELVGPLCAGLRCSQAELEHLLALPSSHPLGLPSGHLSISGVTTLFRAVTLARVLQTPVANVALWFELADLDPFEPMAAGAAPEVTTVEDVVAALQRFGAQRFLATDARDLLLDAPGDDVLDQRHARTQAWLEALRASYTARAQPLIEAIEATATDPFFPPLFPGESTVDAGVRQGLGLMLTALYEDLLPTEVNGDMADFVLDVFPEAGEPDGTAILAHLQDLRNVLAARGEVLELPAGTTTLEALQELLEDDEETESRLMALWMVAVQWWMRQSFAAAQAWVDSPVAVGGAPEAMIEALTAIFGDLGGSDPAEDARKVARAVFAPHLLVPVDFGSFTMPEEWLLEPLAGVTLPPGVTEKPSTETAYNSASEALAPILLSVRAPEVEPPEVAQPSVLEAYLAALLGRAAGLPGWVDFDYYPASGNPFVANTELLPLALGTPGLPRKERAGLVARWIAVWGHQRDVRDALRTWVVPHTPQPDAWVESLLQTWLPQESAPAPLASTSSALEHLSSGACLGLPGAEDAHTDGAWCVHDHLVRAEKAARLAGTFGLTAEDVDAGLAGTDVPVGHPGLLRRFVVARPVELPGTGWAASPGEISLHIFDLMALAYGAAVEAMLPRVSADGRHAWVLALDLARAAAPVGATQEQRIVAVEERIGLPEEERLSAGGPALFGDEGLGWFSSAPATPEVALKRLERLAQLLRMARRFRVRPVGLLAGGIGTPSADTVAVVRATLRGAWSDEAWRARWTPVVDALRERRRDAMVQWLLHHHDPDRLTLDPEPDRGSLMKWRDVPDIYASLLFDPMLNSPVVTSRLVFATGSVQAYVERVRQGLEPGAVMTPTFEFRWTTWMWRYRVWEANRRVFVYPENWLDPAIIAEPTHVYRTLLEGASSNAIDDSAAEGLLSGYVDTLSHVGDIKIVSTFTYHNPLDLLSVRIHVIGRSHGQEGGYFYRSRDVNLVWTPWEPITVGLNARSLCVVASSSHVYALWLEGPDMSTETFMIGDRRTSQARLRAHLRVAVRVASGWLPETAPVTLVDQLVLDNDGYQHPAITEQANEARGSDWHTRYLDSIILRVTPETDGPIERFRVDAIFHPTFPLFSRFNALWELPYVFGRHRVGTARLEGRRVSLVGIWRKRVGILYAPEMPTDDSWDFYDKFYWQNMFMVQPEVGFDETNHETSYQNRGTYRSSPDAPVVPRVMPLASVVTGKGHTRLPGLFRADLYRAALGGFRPELGPHAWTIVEEPLQASSEDATRQRAGTMFLSNGNRTWLGWYQNEFLAYLESSAGLVGLYMVPELFRVKASKSPNGGSTP